MKMKVCAIVLLLLRVVVALGEREEIMAQLEEQMYETEDEKSAARVKAIEYARQINLIFKRLDDDKAQMQRQYKFQFARAKVT